MTYAHPLTYYVLVGGSHDGERWDAEASPKIKLRKNVPDFVMQAIGGEFKALGLIDFEVYTLRIFRADGHLLKVYGLDRMSDYDVMIDLMRGYRRD